MIALLLISDGRDGYRDRCIASVDEMLLHDDAVDVLIEVDDRGHSLGFAGAIQEGWRQVLETDADFVFHLEADFTFNRPVPLADMAAVLQAHPYLTQMALRRQPWNEDERRAGGIVEQHPEDYSDCAVVRMLEDERRTYRWLEHRRCFTTNPSLYPRSLCRRGWPQCDFSEGVFTHELLKDPDVRFGFWGARDSGEWVTHIGEHRAGRGY